MNISLPTCLSIQILPHFFTYLLTKNIPSINLPIVLSIYLHINLPSYFSCPMDTHSFLFIHHASLSSFQCLPPFPFLFHLPIAPVPSRLFLFPFHSTLLSLPPPFFSLPLLPSYLPPSESFLPLPLFPVLSVSFLSLLFPSTSPFFFPALHLP